MGMGYERRTMDTPKIHGTCDARFSAVRDAFAANFPEHNELGAGVAVSVDGRVVVDLWGGFADEAKTRAWERDTIVNAFSVGKGVLSLCLLLLVDRGLVELDAPVARYWPEFAAAGKGEITVRQLVSHQAGLPAVREILPEGAMYDWPRMTAALAAETPWWTPGTKHGYHVNTFGFLVGEIIRRVSGVSPGVFLQRELAEPLGAEFLIGVGPQHDHRVAEFLWSAELALILEIDRSRLSHDDLMRVQTYFNPRGASGHDVVNTVAWRRAEYPSTNAHGTALGVARLYSVVAGKGVVGGRRFLGEELVAEAAREQSSGPDAVFEKPSRFGLGFQLPTLERPLGPNQGVVAHFGVGGAVGFADPEAGLAFGYVMNRMGPRFINPTNRKLIDALYGCL